MQATWRYGETNPIDVAVNAATTIEIGDIVWLDTDDAKPTPSITDQGTDAQNQEYIHDYFLGIAMSRHRGDVDPAGTIRVATTGVFEFDCDTDTSAREFGTIYGPAVTGNAVPTTAERDQVEVVATDNLGIGKLARAKAAADTTVLVAVVSTLVWGGPQSMI